MKVSDKRRGRKKEHGDAAGKKHYIYHIWNNIRNRCYNENSKFYYNYGGRGIIMLEEWRNSYLLFKEYVISNLGEKPYNYTLDRIDNNGNYIPNNLRWADWSIQNKNKRKYIRKPRVDGFKLNETIVSQIKKEINDGVGGSALARKYNVSPMMITLIKQNKTWKHVTT